MPKKDAKKIYWYLFKSTKDKFLFLRKKNESTDFYIWLFKSTEEKRTHRWKVNNYVISILAYILKICTSHTFNSVNKQSTQLIKRKWKKL